MPSSYVNYLTLLLLLIDKCYLGGSEPTQLKEHVGMFYWPDTHPFFNRLVLSGSEPTQLKSQVGIFYRPDTHQLFIIYYYTKYYFVILFYIVINNFPLTFPIFVLRFLHLKSDHSFKKAKRRRIEDHQRPAQLWLWKPELDGRAVDVWPNSHHVKSIKKE